MQQKQHFQNSFQQINIMTFEWIQCSFFLKKNVNNTEITINLTPYHKLQFLNQENQLKDITVDVKIQFEKPLMYDDTIGWNWHKSWNIPDISVQLLAYDAQMNVMLKNLKNLYTQIYVVKPIISKQYSLCIEDLGLQGNTCIEFPNNKCIFSGLKFSATSYNNEGSKFHFLLIVYQNNQEINQSSKILLSRISSPVFVDSRKSAREAQLIKLKKISAYIEPFQISHIHKKFVKKQSKKSKDYTQQQIENNLNGLYNYFGAANIRNKVKHPLFLGIKFDLCFYIYLNRNLFSGKSPKEVIQYLQDTLFQIYKNFQIYKPPTKIETKKIIISIKNQNLLSRLSHNKKIPQFLEILQSDTIGILVDAQNVPTIFEHIKITVTIILFRLMQYQNIRIYFRSLKKNMIIYSNSKRNNQKIIQQIIQTIKKKRKQENKISNNNYLVNLINYLQKEKDHQIQMFNNRFCKNKGAPVKVQNRSAIKDLTFRQNAKQIWIHRKRDA